MIDPLNKAILIGVVENHPTETTFEDGKILMGFNVLTFTKWFDKETKTIKKSTDQKHPVLIRNKLLIDYVKNNNIEIGDVVYIDGELQARKYTTNAGVEIKATEILLKPYCGDIKLIARKNETLENNTNDLNDDLLF